MLCMCVIQSVDESYQVHDIHERRHHLYRLGPDGIPIKVAYCTVFRRFSCKTKILKSVKLNQQDVSCEVLVTAIDVKYMYMYNFVYFDNNLKAVS